MSEENEMYTTTDFYTAALLISLDYEICEVRSENPNGKENARGHVKRFCFLDSDALRKDIMEYMNSKKVGNLRKFRDAIETVKDIVHSG